MPRSTAAASGAPACLSASPSQEAQAQAAAASLAQIPEVLQDLDIVMSPREVLQELLGDLWVEPQNLVLEGSLGGCTQAAAVAATALLACCCLLHQCHMRLCHFKGSCTVDVGVHHHHTLHPTRRTAPHRACYCIALHCLPASLPARRRGRLRHSGAGPLGGPPPGL